MAMKQLTFSAWCECVIYLCDTFKGSVTSWIRSPERNRLFGGLPNSRHIGGWAVDIVLDDHALAGDLVKAAHELELDAVNEGDHVHIELDKKNEACTS